MHFELVSPGLTSEIGKALYFLYHKSSENKRQNSVLFWRNRDRCSRFPQQQAPRSHNGQDSIHWQRQPGWRMLWVDHHKIWLLLSALVNVMGVFSMGVIQGKISLGRQQGYWVQISFWFPFQKKQTFDSRNAFLVSLRTRSMSQTILVPSLWDITGTWKVSFVFLGSRGKTKNCPSEYQCSFFQTSIYVTPSARIAKAELPLICLKTYVHPDPNPALGAWMGFH